MAVYFAQSGAYIKIGYSRDPIARSTTITRTGTRPDDIPFNADVHLIGWVPGDRWRETEYHGRFTDGRVAGEWFYLDPEVAHEWIWADPRGVDVQRMSAWAVLVMDRDPSLTRDDLEAASIPVLGVVERDVVSALFSGGAA